MCIKCTTNADTCMQYLYDGNNNYILYLCSIMSYRVFSRHICLIITILLQ